MKFTKDEKLIIGGRVCNHELVIAFSNTFSTTNENYFSYYSKLLEKHFSTYSSTHMLPLFFKHKSKLLT